MYVDVHYTCTDCTDVQTDISIRQCYSGKFVSQNF